jgi:hypothetical protein
VGLAEVDNVDPVTRVKDETLHLGIPTLCLVSKMNASIQQFFNTDANHNFPLLKIRLLANHPAEHGIILGVIMAVPTSAAVISAIVAVIN